MRRTTVEQFKEQVKQKEATKAEVRLDLPLAGSAKETRKIDVLAYSHYFEIPSDALLNLWYFINHDELVAVLEKYDTIGQWMSTPPTDDKNEPYFAAVPSANSTRLNWIVEKIRKGQNGSPCVSFRTLSNIMLSKAAVEFVPHDVDSVVCHKSRPESCPIFPISAPDYLTISCLFYLSREGLTPIPAPRVLDVACKSAHNCTWPLSSFSEKILADVNNAVEGLSVVTNIMIAALITGPDNLNAMRDQIKENLSLAISRNIKSATGKSIFANDTTAWKHWFNGVSTTIDGRLTLGRALAAIPFDGFVGEVEDVALWSITPRVIKSTSSVTTTVNHTHIPIDIIHAWPTSNFCMVNPTPADLNLAFAACRGRVTGLAMPITQVLSNAPQITIFGMNHNYVRIVVCASNPAVVIFISATENETSLAGASLQNYIKQIEKAFINVFIKFYGNRLFGGLCYYAEIKFKGQQVTTDLLDIEYPLTNTAYMSSNDDFKRRFISAYTRSDITIDGYVDAVENSETISGYYPRAHVPKLERVPNPGELVNKDGSATNQERQIDIMALTKENKIRYVTKEENLFNFYNAAPQADVNGGQAQQGAPAPGPGGADPQQQGAPAMPEGEPPVEEEFHDADDDMDAAFARARNHDDAPAAKRAKHD